MKCGPAQQRKNTQRGNKQARYAADLEKRLRERYQERIIASAILGGCVITVEPIGFLLHRPIPEGYVAWNGGMIYATRYKAARAWLNGKGIII